MSVQRTLRRQRDTERGGSSAAARRRTGMPAIRLLPGVMPARLLLLGVMLAGLLLLGGCGAGKAGGGNPLQEEGSDPLRGGSQAFDLNTAQPLKAGEIKDGEGYYLRESFRRSELSEKEWNLALEIFSDRLDLRFEDESFSFEGKEDLWYIRGMFRDKQDYTYVIADTSIRMIDPKGKTVTVREYQGANDDSPLLIGEPVISDAGEVVFPIFREIKRVELVSFDRETGAERLLGEAEDRFFRNPLCAMRGSVLFYRSENRIVSWDLATGERMHFFDLKGAGVGERDVIMAFSDEGVPMLYIGGSISAVEAAGSAAGDELVVSLGSEPIETGFVIQISDLCGDYDNGFVASCVGAYQVDHPDVSFDYQTWKKDDEREAFQTRVLAEIVSGKSADILCFDRSVLYMLWEKGAIAGLDGLISEETWDALLPGVRELCTVDGEMAAIAPVISVAALGAPARNWDKDTWTIEEFMEQTRKQGKKYAWVGPGGSSGWCEPYFLLLYSGIPSLEHLGLIDYQKGTASLDSEGYVELLEFCKEYGLTKKLGQDEYEACLKNRESMANTNGFVYRFYEFERLYSIYEGQDCHICGFPAGDTSYNYLSAPKCLAVSKKAAEDPQKREEIAAFLEYLLSEEGQKNIFFYLGVRRPTPENCYEVDTEWRELEEGRYYAREIVLMGQKEHATLRKPDGTTCLKDFMEFLENCRPEPYRSADLTKIITEEALVFFEGGRSAEETARITQNRVQLYLNERKQ